MKKTLYFAVLLVLLASCAVKMPTKSVAYKSLYNEKPLSVLALPPINKSTKVEAKELFYSSLSVPITLKGYYVLPPLLSMEILKEESAYDAEVFVNSSMKKVGELFGVDAVLFTTIHEWSKSAIAKQINVKIEYLLKSTKTDEILFNRIGNITMVTGGNSGNFLADMVGGMIATALTNEIIVGRNCNILTLSDLPEGKYGPMFQKDGETFSQPKEFSKVIK